LGDLLKVLAKHRAWGNGNGGRRIVNGRAGTKRGKNRINPRGLTAFSIAYGGCDHRVAEWDQILLVELKVRTGTGTQGGEEESNTSFKEAQRVKRKWIKDESKGCKAGKKNPTGGTF